MLQAAEFCSKIRVMTREKRLINSFVLANLCDVVVTGVALTLPGFMEKGLLGEEMLAQAQGSELLILKIAITAFMIGIYALAAHRKDRWSHPIEAAIKISAVIVWVAVAWNEFNVVVALAHML